MGQVVLVTGAARRLSGRLIRRLQRAEGVDAVLAVDTVTPRHPIGDAEFVETDIRHPAVGALIARRGVNTVVHLDVGGGTAPHRRSRATVKETNVIGTMQLLGACQKAPSVRRLVVRSSTHVYGGAPRDPAVCRETTVSGSVPGGGFAEDTVEVEEYVRGFARRRPDVAVTVLRFADILGPTADEALAGYLTLPVLPTVLGYDPRLQFVHEDDALAALELAAGEARRGSLAAGTFNVAGDGVLLLSQCARRLGRPVLPLVRPALSWAGTALRTVGIADFSPEYVRLLTHGRVVSTALMRETLGFSPEYTTAEALADFAGRHGPGLLPPRAVAGAVDRFEEAVRRA
ncbi:NAD-dependent epimerase/dehydratase family protein [Streptomyces sp. WMMC1477]|uniref:NAD-dependent epimerase/dehydratase family protein n=1 Tax=Streptomyces sp. WMMC1477 TaxID=3015155 RepID=UPI0022B5F125|nr:NAD-dependent epimerase/dehydratase family protein [Streptomyces sp. WMMC1477]MCZ7432736.1 NAD-dependent epimerase/dehydratase family protein [Streptomyces sp. WMMC1477]